MKFEVRTEYFNGPLDALLELIEQKQIEVTRVSLATVTGDFIEYVKRLETTEGVEPSILADFIVVAARMLLIKSKTLLPTLELTEEEEAEIMDLEERLKLYREFKHAGEYMKKLWEKNKTIYAREFMAALNEPDSTGKVKQFFYPPQKVGVNEMVKSLESLFSIIKDLIPEERTVKQNVVTLQQKIGELTTRLQQAVQFTIKGLAKKSEKQEVIVLFLAVLHMLANKLADVEQGERFGDIIVKKATAEAVTVSESPEGVPRSDAFDA